MVPVKRQGTFLSLLVWDSTSGGETLEAFTSIQGSWFIADFLYFPEKYLLLNSLTASLLPGTTDGTW